TYGVTIQRLGTTVLKVILLQHVRLCKILKCNSEFWASTSHSAVEAELCSVLRAYNSCVRRTARSCRGDLTYHSAQHGIEDLLTQHNCSKNGPTAPPHTRTAPPPPPPPVLTNGPEACRYDATATPTYSHCGFFGDPHLRTFTDDFHTCKVEGAWPLIHNKYLSVQVTNTAVVPGSMATATSKLTIIFKSFQACVEQKTFHAETDELPAAFTDGSKNGGEGPGAKTLRVVEKVPGEHVEIQAQYIGTTVVVRQVGRYLTFAVRMPEEVVTAVEEQDKQDLYLCLHGCPSNQRINFRKFRGGASESATRTRSVPTAARRFTYQTAKATCKERLPVEDLYFHSCVFDLLSSGDLNFTLAAFYALEDVKTLHANTNRHHIFESDALMGGTSLRGGVTVSVLLLHVLAVLLWYECVLVCL
uniref:Repulsive guidance molecule BMP co-receptor a n=1 Tax=Gouania willdenowi TaxID=441366 RepID=A0A8C5DU29_GOUWI